MSTEPDLARSVGLDDYLGILRRRWRLIVAILSLAGVAAAVWSLERVPSYQATTSILIQPITSDQFDSQVRPDQLLNMTNEQQVVLSTPVAAKAVAAMRAWATPEELLERVSVDVPANSQILAIHFSDPAPRTAQLGADELAKAYLDVRAMGVKQRIKASVANLQRQIEALGQRRQAQNAILSRSTATPAERQSAQGLKDTLTQQITSLDQKIADLQQLNASPGAIIQPAVLPTTRTSPNHKVDLGIGLAIGLLAGVAAALVRDRIDLRLRGYEDLAERLGRPVLARVPPFPRWERSGVLGWRRRSGSESSLITLEQPNGLIAEAYRTLRIRLARLASQLDIKTVMVVSAGVGEGKSTTAANLAVVTAESGRSVLLVSADLRRPRIHELFALPNTSGLSNLLLDANEALSDDGGAETPPCDEEGTELASHVWSLTFNLWVITSGPPPPHPSSLMDSNAMRQFLKGRRDLYDVILLDCPPALLAADSLALAPLVDAILVVADAKVSSRSAVSQLGELLQQVGGTVIGSVLNRSRQPSGVRYDHEVE